MAENAKRNTLKKVDGEQMAKGIYHAVFTDGNTFTADLRDLPLVGEDGKPTGEKLGTQLDQLAAVCPMAFRELCYGHKQKLDDAQAGVESIEDALEELKSTWDAIVSGQWTMRIPGEGVEGGLFQRAYAKWKNISLADAKGKLAALVERNLKANQEMEKDEEKRAKITERRVFNNVRDAMLQRNPNLAVIYKDLQEKRKSKPKESGLEIDTSEE